VFSLANSVTIFAPLFLKIKVNIHRLEVNRLFDDCARTLESIRSRSLIDPLPVESNEGDWQQSCSPMLLTKSTFSFVTWVFSRPLVANARVGACHQVMYLRQL